MLKKLNALLSLLPFNGDKLKLSGLFILLSQVTALIPGLDLKTLVLMILDNPTKSGIIAAVVALLHKVIKAQIPSPR